MENFFRAVKKILKNENETQPRKLTKDFIPDSQSTKDERKKYSPMQLISGTAQSVGVVRDHNEDTLFAMTSVLSEENFQMPYGLFIIADGMGGHQNGEVASRMAVRTVVKLFSERLFSKIFGINEDRNFVEDIKEILEQCVIEAQKNVVLFAPGGGTTLTIAFVIGDQAYVAHVGDSRIYLTTEKTAGVVITTDHSLVKRLVDVGEITEEEAAIHPKRNVLYRAVGQAEPYRPDIQQLEFPNPGSMLLCSDGLWGVVPKEEILKIVEHSENPSEACSNLIRAANDNGGPDNISAIIVRYLD
jgi:PPM family protein phosphatase